MTKGPVSSEAVSVSTALRILQEELPGRFAQRQPAGGRGESWERISVPVAPLDILSWLHAQKIFPKIFWQGRDSFLECAALGRAYACGRNGQARAEILSSVQVFVEQLPSAARLWGGIGFDPGDQDAGWEEYGPARFVLPRLEILREGQQYTLALNVSRKSDTLDGLLGFLAQLKMAGAPETPGLLNSKEVLTMDHDPAPEQWKRKVRRIQDLITREQVHKVVLARKTVIKQDLGAGPLALLYHIRAVEIPASHYFFVFQFTPGSAFIGVSPERLFRRSGTTCSCEALAATARRGMNENQDRCLKEKLLTSAKERHEHQIVVDMLTRALAPLCNNLTFDPHPKLLTLKSGFHLLTLFQGDCSGPQADRELLLALHPTPAVAGTPTEKALRLIRELEPFSRGWYAGPLGYWGRAETEFCVAIRSGLWQNQRLTLYAGAGIVKGSAASSEWNELDHKLVSYLKVLDYDQTR